MQDLVRQQPNAAISPDKGVGGCQVRECAVEAQYSAIGGAGRVLPHLLSTIATRSCHSSIHLRDKLSCVESVPPHALASAVKIPEI